MNKKAVIYLTGGLGNQLFQYAFARSLQSNYNIECEINTNFYFSDFKEQTPREIGLNLFNLKFKESRNSNFQKLILRIKEKLFSFNTSFFNENNLNQNNFNDINLNKKNYFRGYWQNYKYFESIKSELKEDFSLDHNLGKLDLITYNKIIDTNSVCIHVRRGDIIGTLYDVVELDYYQKAFEHLSSKVLNLNFFIFSDDINWCKENFSFINNPTFCSFTMLNDFHLMSLCKYFIITNSTFSWWAAYLSNHKEKIVIAPSKWHRTNLKLLKDASPPNWIILNNN
jgi:hypothetical protein